MLRHPNTLIKYIFLIVLIPIISNKINRCETKERGKYGKIGWNVNYDFNEFDFDISAKVLSLFGGKDDRLQSKENIIPWNGLRYLLGEVSNCFISPFVVQFFHSHMLFCTQIYRNQFNRRHRVPSTFRKSRYI